MTPQSGTRHTVAAVPGVMVCTCCGRWRVEPYPLVITDTGAWQRTRLRVTHNGYVQAVCRTVDEVAAAVPPDVFVALAER